MDTFRIWPNTDKKAIRFLCFSSSGDLLATQSVPPDYEITVWNWKEASIHIRLKTTFCDHINEMNFSSTDDRALHAGGVKHLHFWNIVRTFTGLKLLHTYGSFGKYEDCDVLCIHPENNGRVLTNCDWGNILVWQNGEVRFEICGKNRRPCHQKSITQIELKGDYLYTIGLDGFIRIWFWDPLAFLALVEDERFIELEVSYEFQIPSNVQLIDNKNLEFVIDEQDGYVFYIHDGDGVIWKCVVDVEYTVHEIDVAFRSSSRDVISACISACDTQIATLDINGIICIYNIENGEMLSQQRFNTKATAITWSPHYVNACFHLYKLSPGTYTYLKPIIKCDFRFVPLGE